jgi:putative ABC transport system permease protein
MVKRGRRDVGHAVSTSRTGTLRGQCLADSRRSLDHQQTLPPRVAPIAASIAAIRSESAGDLRTLTATGATVRIRRTLTATTAGALALLGALLGVGGTYIVLSATYHDDLGYLSDVPVLWLVLALVGVPLAAAGAGWLLAGREPPAIARTVIE